MPAIRLQIEVAVEDGTPPTLQTVGEIYHAGAGAGPPLVTHVIASPTWPTGFPLDPGEYEYRFHVERAGGLFSVVIKRLDGSGPLQKTSYDTALGMEHRVFRFAVKA
jgi:hypothetical protein